MAPSAERLPRAESHSRSRHEVNKCPRRASTACTPGCTPRCTCFALTVLSTVVKYAVGGLLLLLLYRLVRGYVVPSPLENIPGMRPSRPSQRV